MKITTFKILFLLLYLLLAIPLRAEAFSKVYVFGDSLSDNGNLAALSLVSPDAAQFAFLNDPPYQNAFTNGPTAAVQLANLLGSPPLTPSLYFLGSLAGTNFAVAGARAAGNEPIDLNAQFGAFFASQPGNVDADALYLVFIGGNDIRDMRDKKSQIRSILTAAMRNMNDNLALLIAKGARHIMIANSPDIGSLPETHALAANKPGLVVRTKLLTQTYNTSLASTVAKLEKMSGLDMVMFDVFTLFNQLVNDNRALAFVNAKDACFSSVGLVYYPICDENQLDQFIFFDEIHPTRRIHERVARGMFAQAPE